MYHVGARDAAEALATRREPVNIAMEQYYDRDLLHRHFGYRDGAYGALSADGERLPPQIAIACRTPIRNPRAPESKIVTMINLIGMAFDTPAQPDYKFFYRSGKLDKRELLARMTQVYAFAFRAAAEYGKKYLCVSPVGDVAFRPKRDYATPDAFVREIIKPAVQAASTSFPGVTPIWAQFPEYHVPDCFFDETSPFSNVDDKMFINAWDCWSMPGNGNDGDNSLDGFWGRSSAIALLCWPTSNRQIRYVSVE